MSAHRPVDGPVKTIQVQREARKWTPALSCDDVATRPVEPTGTALDADMALASFAVTSAGQHIDNPRRARTAAGKLNFHHNTARALAADHDLIVVEGLKTANTVRPAKPHPDPNIPRSLPGQ